MTGFWRILKWATLGVAIAALLLAYPVSIAVSHRLPSGIPSDLPEGVWADTRIGAAIELLETEMDDRGWASARHSWHPQARLTAMPAFQSGLTDVVSEFARRRAELANASRPDRDLMLASGLLAQAISEEAESRIRAAIEAMRRFDGLKARAVLSDLSRDDLFAQEISLYSDLLNSSAEDLARMSRTGSRAPVSPARTEIYFRVLGRIYAIGALLKASEAISITEPGYRSAFAAAQTALSQALKPRPLIVSNPAPGTFSLGGDDVVVLAFLVGQTHTQLEALNTLIAGTPSSGSLPLVQKS
ncbi:MAG: hypothetical protein CMK06_02940 [Ponticaulis sp.]|nr:hypothetical protein [Ponticaulis sp.]